MTVNNPLPLAGPVLAAGRRPRESTILRVPAVLRVSAAPHETIRRP